MYFDMIALDVNRGSRVGTIIVIASIIDIIPTAAVSVWTA